MEDFSALIVCKQGESCCICLDVPRCDNIACMPCCGKEICKSPCLPNMMFSGSVDCCPMCREPIPESVEACFYLYRKNAEKGKAWAQYCLGGMYAKGAGVGKCEKTAAIWLERAAKQGEASAQYNLGVRYTNGRGVGKCEKTAAILYERAAKQGHANAQFNLGICYAGGDGVGKCEKTAAIWYKRAAKQGHVRAQCNLGLL
jgi:TPR repeat protein